MAAPAGPGKSASTPVSSKNVQQAVMGLLKHAAAPPHENEEEEDNMAASKPRYQPPRPVARKISSIKERVVFKLIKYAPAPIISR